MMASSFLDGMGFTHEILATGGVAIPRNDGQARKSRTGYQAVDENRLFDSSASPIDKKVIYFLRRLPRDPMFVGRHHAVDTWETQSGYLTAPRQAMTCMTSSPCPRFEIPYREW